MRASRVSCAWVLGVALFAGCSPSVEQVKALRVVPPTPDLKLQQMELLKWFAKGGHGPLWRMEVMTTLVDLDAKMKLYPGPDARGQIIAALKDEYLRPGLNAGASSSDRMRLAAWAIYSLGRLKDPATLETMIQALERNDKGSDPSMRIRLAAMNGLVLQVDAIRKNDEYRNRTLLALLALSPRHDGGEVVEQADSPPAHFVAHLMDRLSSHDHVVSLLGYAIAQGADARTLSALVLWLYQHERAVAADSKARPAPHADGVKHLLTLAWNEDENVRNQSRIALGDLAPGAFLDHVARKSGAPHVTGDDCELLANLLPLADAEAARVEDKTYGGRRKTALEAMRRAALRVPAPSRELLYARLFALEPRLLAEWLVGLNQSAVAGDHALACQHLRYLGRLRSVKPVQDDAPLARSVSRSIGEFMLRNEEDLRAQVAALLLESEPGVLAESLGPILSSLSTQKSADQVANLYIASLEGIEKAAATLPYAGEGGVRVNNAHPYASMRYLIEQERSDIRGKAVHFLESRDPSLAASLLGSHIVSRTNRGLDVPGTDFAMLGDLCKNHVESLSEASLELVPPALHAGLTSRDEEVVLLCVRYILEMSLPLTAEQKASLPEAAQALVLLLPGAVADDE